MKLRFAAAASLVLAGTGWTQVTQRVSVATGGAQASGYSFYPSFSADGRYVAFFSDASDLVPGDTNDDDDVFVRDRWTGVTERVSVSSSGAQGDSASEFPSISADGNCVAFLSWANLIYGGTLAYSQVYVHDRRTGTTEIVSVDSTGFWGYESSGFPSISADGRYVSFVSWANNLVPGDTNGLLDIFVRDRQLGTTERVSVDSNGNQGNDSSGEGFAPSASISADGRYVAFISRASNLVPGDTNQNLDIFVRDRLLGLTERVSVDSNGAQGNGGCSSQAISADGRYVAFDSGASNLVPGDTNGSYDVFVHDRLTGATERVSVDSSGAQANGSSFEPSISSDGNCVMFQSGASNLVSGDTNGITDVFLRDRRLGTTERVSVDSSGAQGNAESDDPAISSDGRFAAFDSYSTDLVPGDTNGEVDVFVRDRHASGFTSLCDPGSAGVISCPCSNPPSGAVRGCDNSSATGGATLNASGVAYLSTDSLTFTTDGETPAAFSIVMQGNAGIAHGLVFGQGVRCLGGTIIRRLFIKQAIAGSITAPDSGSGDPAVSARSASKGDVIQAGQSRWYLVYYRDPVVLGGCPAGATFNATQTGQVTWLP